MLVSINFAMLRWTKLNSHNTKCKTKASGKRWATEEAKLVPVVQCSSKIWPKYIPIGPSGLDWVVLTSRGSWMCWKENHLEEISLQKVSEPISVYFQHGKGLVPLARKVRNSFRQNCKSFRQHRLRHLLIYLCTRLYIFLSLVTVQKLPFTFLFLQFFMSAGAMVLCLSPKLQCKRK